MATVGHLNSRQWNRRRRHRLSTRMTEQEFDFGCLAWHTSGVSHDNNLPWAGVPAPAHALSDGIISQLALGVKYILTQNSAPGMANKQARFKMYPVFFPS